MSQLLGTVIAAEITTGDTANTWSLGNLNLFQGGHKTAASLAERDAITPERRAEGMSCWVVATAQMFRLIGGIANTNWVLDSGGGNGTTDLVARTSADFAIYLASSGTAGVGQVYPIANAGTTMAQLAWTWIGTLNGLVGGNVDASARAGVLQVEAIAVSGTAGVHQVYNIADSGTSGANFAIFLAGQGTNGVNQVYPIANAGTNLGRAAYGIACIGTNVGSNAYTLAQAGTKVGKTMVFCAGYTPVSNGADVAEVTVPYSHLDGSTVLPWTARRFAWRAQQSGTTYGTIAFEKSIGLGVFSAVSMGTVVLPAGTYEAFLSGSLGMVNSGDKMRFNVLALSSAQNWCVSAEISNP